MRTINFEENELAVMAIFKEKTRQETVAALKEALEALETLQEPIAEDEMIEIVTATIEKLQLIEDRYYYSLDLNAYLNNLEDDVDET